MTFLAKQIGILFASRRWKRTPVGSYLYLTLPENRCAKLEFIPTKSSDDYDAIRVTILDTHAGKIDEILLPFRDFFAPQPLKGGISTTVPHIWQDYVKACWFKTPTDAEREALSDAITSYISLFD